MTHIINQNIPEEHRDFIWDLAHTIKTYRKIEGRWRDAVRTNDEKKAAICIHDMLDFEWKLYERYLEKAGGESAARSITMNEVYRDMKPEELALCNLRLHTAVMCVDQIEENIMVCNEVLRRYYPNGRIESFVPILKMGEEARRLRHIYVDDGNKNIPGMDELFADYADSISNYLDMRMRSMLKKLHKLKEKHKRNGGANDKD